ncbi:MAG: radical SAM protein [Planctomycetes bacterium]|jgi:putative pyruvate formate lyase activating enzyme|nr:radical SAM protein [Planctomycetota bacterium]
MFNKVKIAWFGKHLGEEPPLIPAGGIFFTGCNLRCVFCQNYQISQQNLGQFYTIEELAEIMLKLQNIGANNIDLVSPTIWYKQIKEAICLARKNGLAIPIIWNSNAYENLEVLKEVEGLIDIYLPDFKYSNNELGLKYSKINNYSLVAEKAIKEMWRQVGNLRIRNGKAYNGLIIRHLVLPNNIENSFGVLDKIAKINLDIHVSLMNQYSPLYKANEFPEINRELNREEFFKVYDYYKKLGLGNGWIQEEKSQNNLVPDFKKDNPFN